MLVGPHVENFLSRNVNCVCHVTLSFKWAPIVSTEKHIERQKV